MQADQVRGIKGVPSPSDLVSSCQRQQAGSRCGPLLHPGVGMAGMLGAVLSEDRVGTPVGGRKPELPNPSVLPGWLEKRMRAAQWPCSAPSDKNREGWRNPGCRASLGRGSVSPNEVPGGHLQIVGGQPGPHVGASSAGKTQGPAGRLSQAIGVTLVGGPGILMFEKNCD